MSVVKFEVTKRVPYADGVAFGEAGSYTRLDGKLHFSVDPRHAVNAGIVDLELVPSVDGRVTFSSDITVLSPDDPTRANGSLVLDIPNRGSGTAAANFNRARFLPAAENSSPGDGFLFRHGFALASVGWQVDLAPFPGALTIDPPVAGSPAAPVLGLVMAEVRPTRHDDYWPVSQGGNSAYPPVDLGEAEAAMYMLDYEDGPLSLIPRSKWAFETDASGQLLLRLQGGLAPGHIYRVVYTSANPPVVGSGLLATRDAATFLRQGAAGELAAGFERVIAFGASQCGRFLRHFLYLGLNRDEDGVIALDGVFSFISGGRRGEFNHRFALPSSASMPGFGELFPFADGRLKDELTGQDAGLLDALRERDAVPRIIYANSSREYWRGDASLLHIDPQGTRDIEPGPTTRIYHFAGTQHTPGRVPQVAAMPALGAELSYGMNVVDYVPLTRAALMNLDAWIRGESEPPPSRFPRIADKTATTRDLNLQKYASLPGVTPVDVRRLPVSRCLDMGSESSRGIGRYPPKELGTYATLVPALDEDLNELSGVRLPDLSVPVGSHLGWNTSSEASGDPLSAPRSINFGLTRFFSRTLEEARETHDPRTPLNVRYSSRDDYLTEVRNAAIALTAERYLASEDVDLVVSNCAERYDEASKVGPYNPEEQSSRGTR